MEQFGALVRQLIRGALAATWLLPAAALAQAPGGGASMQTQLGAIPLVSPRATAKPATVRTVRLTQVDAARAPIGAAREITCPDTGCQQLLALVVDKASEMFIADIQFVGRGAYFALQPRSLAIGNVVEFDKGRPGPVFIKDDGRDVVEQQVRYVVAAPGSVRKLDAVPKSGTLTSGNVFNRKLEPDLILQVEILPSRPAG